MDNVNNGRGIIDRINNHEPLVLHYSSKIIPISQLKETIESIFAINCTVRVILIGDEFNSNRAGDKGDIDNSDKAEISTSKKF
jgi:hypothetical protein